MIPLLNIGRVLMVGWVVFSLTLIFFPSFLHRPPDQVGGAIQFGIAYSIGWCLDRALGFVRRRKAAAAGMPVES